MASNKKIDVGDKLRAMQKKDFVDYFNRTFSHFPGGNENRQELRLDYQIDNYTPKRQDIKQKH
jgi:hypothetical protein